MDTNEPSGRRKCRFLRASVALPPAMAVLCLCGVGCLFLTGIQHSTDAEGSGVLWLILAFPGEAVVALLCDCGLSYGAFFASVAVNAAIVYGVGYGFVRLAQNISVN